MSIVQDSAVENPGADVADRAMAHLMRSGNCAQTSFALLNETFDLDGEQVLRALTPFPGIALRGETCGAVTGSLMALGLVYGRNDIKDWNAYIRSLPPARRFCARFAEGEGGTTCSAILQKRLGRDFDLDDKMEAMQYATSGGPAACAEVVANAVTIAAESIAKIKTPKT